MRDIVRGHLGSEDAVGHLREYFGLDGGAAYTGARFEGLGGGGDRVGVADVVTAEDLVARVTGIGWVTTGKLLARKRPRLLPVYDNVVKCVLGRPRHFWLPLHTALRAEDRALHHTLLDLRKRAGVPETVSALRVCDVVLWMAHAKDHKAGRCAGHGTLSV
ncbi:DUF6308 family protein [Streptomyces griseoluteus]|uniref:DUF6308 family protein n=1 Tax=Streptomyces griseoluteus TaxID=29306 RepID=UPI0036EE967F